MTPGDYIRLTIATVLIIVIYEVLKGLVSSDTLEMIMALVGLLLIPILTGASVIALRKKAWVPALACAALAAILTFGVFRVLSAHWW